MYWSMLRGSVVNLLRVACYHRGTLKRLPAGIENDKVQNIPYINLIVDTLFENAKELIM